MRRVGIKQVAERAGVSTATVSYVMNGTGRVAEKTREKVLEAASELGFVRDDTAARLRTGRSKLIGVILNNIVNPFFSELVAGIELAAYQQGYLTLISTAQNDKERQARLLQSMVSQGVGVIILSPVHDTVGDDLFSAGCGNIPVISCVRDIPGSAASFVGVNEEMSGYLAARELLLAGHRNMTFIGGYAHTSTWSGRRDGIIRALEEFNLPKESCRLFPGPLSREFAAQTVLDLIESDDLGTALLSFNDDMAAGIYRVLKQKALCIGTELSVVSFDNVPIAADLEPALSTVDIFPKKIGEKSAELAVELIRASSLERQEHVLKPAFVAGASIRK